MRCKISGQVMKVQSGTNRNTGKEYTVAHIYDGDDLLRVYNVDLNTVLKDTYVELTCNVRVDYDAKTTFISALR